MDIYLVNSGPSDFYQPKKPIRNALYKNNRDGTFTDVTEAAGVPGGTFGESRPLELPEPVGIREMRQPSPAGVPGYIIGAAEMKNGNPG
jgi:hypothetical protein